MGRFNGYFGPNSPGNADLMRRDPSVRDSSEHNQIRRPEKVPRDDRTTENIMS